MPTRDAKAGFTLIELMVVVAVIGLGTAMSAAGIGEAFSDNRALRASRELVRVGRRAKAEALGYMRAHLVWIEPRANRVSLIRGRGWSCTNENWNERFSDGPCRATGANSTPFPCIDQVNFDEGNTDNDEAYWPSIDFVSGSPITYNRTATADTALCYAPSGQLFSAQGLTLAGLGIGVTSQLSPNNVNGGFLFAVRRLSGADQLGLTRWVLFPQGAPARLIR